MEKVAPSALSALRETKAAFCREIRWYRENFRPVLLHGVYFFITEKRKTLSNFQANARFEGPRRKLAAIFKK